ncbi:hypothetical protein I6Y99_004555 [Vibrio parahaemolyticus]|uniref:DUF5384 family protein n=1 Tax=Vibrio parahaemolyticus TaxID=670 RepID=UPI001122EC36|nr:DUF5384 family protein [Vibrio parahaemolyticus]EGQ7795934.1 hypothetical protein [Vibrio parahaemolyticus]EGQ7810511.1 hypothetical protein [Vibrio parahaemolyticus]EGQ8533355.1 hypothetical protein [Vibrio parahaemolyticus]EJB8505150.1 DUF5384 family protein [Vibrio parahaemolyticus]EJB8691183.1 DUF5384 family protein [Vibrio parahaemolyticus]
MKLSFRLLSTLLFGCFSFSALATADLSTQLGAIKNAEQVNQNNLKILEAEKQRQAQEQAAALAKANAEKAKKAQAERMAKLKEQRLANETKDAERLADKYRDQSFEDELRKMQLEEMKLELARKKARVERENEVIDAELSHAEATTDVIQSKADSNRNISQGVKSALESEGKAKEEEASSWFH